MKAEADGLSGVGLGGFRHGKADHDFGCQMVRRRVEFGVDNVAGAGKCGWLRRLG